MDVRCQKIRSVPRCYRVAQHLSRILTNVGETLSLNLTFPGQDFCSQDLNQSLFTVPELVANKPQFFMSYQDSESRAGQIQACGVYDKWPRVDWRVAVILVVKFLLVSQQDLLNVVSQSEVRLLIQVWLRESPAAFNIRRSRTDFLPGVPLEQAPCFARIDNRAWFVKDSDVWNTGIHYRLQWMIRRIVDWTGCLFSRTY